MSRMHAAAVAALLLGLALPAGARAASCFQGGRGHPFVVDTAPPTLFRNLAQAPVVLHAYAANPRDLGDGTTTTDLVVVRALKGARFLRGKAVVETPRFLPVKDAGNPPHYVVSVDVY